MAAPMPWELPCKPMNKANSVHYSPHAVSWQWHGLSCHCHGHSWHMALPLPCGRTAVAFLSSTSMSFDGNGYHDTPRRCHDTTIGLLCGTAMALSRACLGHSGPSNACHGTTMGCHWPSWHCHETVMDYHDYSTELPWACHGTHVPLPWALMALPWHYKWQLYIDMVLSSALMGFHDPAVPPSWNAMRVPWDTRGSR